MLPFCNVKCCFIFFNLVFLASGVGLVIIGAKQYSTYKAMGAFAGNGLSKIAIVLIAVGASIVLVSFMGHLGAFFNSYSMVSCFICILIVIIIMETLTGIAFYMLRKRAVIVEVKNAIDHQSKARRVIQEYAPEKRHAIDKIQEKFKCCGADGPEDWSTSVGWEEHDAVPDSCCMVKMQGCGKEKDKVRSKGCLQAINLFLMKNLMWIGALCIALGVTEVAGVVVGACLCVNLKRKNYENMS
ncbi:CD63 antigen-like [Sebastes fasciatus]|uniref:CD63 antigen-like n=1 Tax=Sebastes fasciatus TaxID=394691 RepID=UPI003D9F34B3